jgi:hypothetical protein
MSNSKNAREQLNKSKQKAKAGIPQEGEFKKTEKKVKIKGGTTGERELVIYDLPIPTHLRK